MEIPFTENEKSTINRIARTNDFEWNQFCQLGEMIGDGLHHESDGRWITKEYKRLSKILIPELKEQDKLKRKLKSENVNQQLSKMLVDHKCSCGGLLKQSRSGSKICYCSVCNARYRAGKKK